MKIISQLMLLSLLNSSQIMCSDEDAVVAIPDCIITHKNVIESMAENSKSIKDFVDTMDTGMTTYEKLKCATEEMCTILKDCSDNTLCEFKNDLIKVDQLIKSQDKSMFIDTNKIYRKKCCCYPSTATFTSITSGTVKATTITATSAFVVGSSGPKIISGSGAPTSSAPQGSIYLRTNGTADTTLYVNTDGSTSWTALTST